jgi:uncharacterized protein YdeI (BOF family)
MKNYLRVVAALLTFTAGMVALAAQSRNPSTAPEAQPASAAQQQPAQQDDMQAQQPKPFNGTIVKEKGKLVLKDSTTSMSYQLDDQDKAKEFEGKQVKVTGKLDVNANLIHVENIEAGS